jgi:precorrin-6B methylase 2
MTTAIVIFNNVAFWILVLLLVWQGYNLIFNRGVPNIHTAPAIRKRVIALIKQDMAAKDKKHYTIIDLGSGNGAFTRQMARAIPEAKVIGLEVSPQALALSNALKKKQKLDNLEYKKADFFSYDLSEADAITMYLVHSLMERMGKKLHQNLKKGTLISSNKFRLGDGWEPEKTMEVRSIYLHQKKVFIYRK